MAHIKYLPDDDIPKEYRVPDSDHILRIHSVHPAVMHAHFELYMHLMHRTGPLTRRQREMIAVTVSGLNECHY